MADSKWPPGTVCRCLRCDGEWLTRREGKPTYCAKCKSAAWDKPPQTVERAAQGVGTLPEGSI